MGVRFLARYFEENNLYQFVGMKVNMVVDGTSLLYFLTKKFNPLVQNQFTEFLKTLDEFVSHLEQQGAILKCFCFHGSRVTTTLKHRIFEDTETIRIIEQLLTQVPQTCNLLEEQSVEYVSILMDKVMQTHLKKKYRVAVADGEQDKLCAKLANELESVVLSNDSDFCIFPISRGYMPLYKLGHVCYHSSLSKKLEINESLLPLFACAAGTKIVPFKRLLRDFYTPSFFEGTFFENICQKLRTLKTNEPKEYVNLFVSSDYFERVFNRGVESYNFDVREVSNYGLLLDLKKNVFFCRPLLEDIEQSYWLDSQKLRCIAYRKHEFEVTEYQLDEKVLKKQVVQNEFTDIMYLVRPFQDKPPPMILMVLRHLKLENCLTTHMMLVIFSAWKKPVKLTEVQVCITSLNLIAMLEAALVSISMAFEREIEVFDLFLIHYYFDLIPNDAEQDYGDFEELFLDLE